MGRDPAKTAKKVKAPEVLYEEPELTVRVVRDLFTDEEYRELVTDSPRVHEKIMDYVRDVAPDLEPKITLHEGKLPAFEEHRIVEQIHKALDRKVWLPSGGYLIIERTEAMTIIDVNTGKSVGKTNLEETVVNTNLEAVQGGRAPAAAARHRRHHRDRLHRYAAGEEQEAGRGHHEGGPGASTRPGPRCSRSARWG